MSEPTRLELLAWILGSGILMSAVALVGSATLLLSRRLLDALVQPLVALAAGSLLGGAFFHMLPHAVHAMGAGVGPWGWCVVGFTVFLALDQLLHWHHCHRATHSAEPLTWLLLVADTLHNLLGGLAVGAVFVLDLRAGLVAWTAAVLHEVPQELGDFGVLVHGGFSPRRALLFNLLSALTFPIGGVVAWWVGGHLDVGPLVALGAGNFIYVAAADLVPEFKGARRLRDTLIRFVLFGVGAALVLAVRLLGDGG